MSPRVPCGRSCPGQREEASDIPRLDERIGNRLCDGTMRPTERDNMGWGLADHPLAMVYAPYQLFRDIYTEEVALNRGTMFAELDLPFEGDKKKSGGCLC